MEVVILGTSACVENPGNACSGCLVRERGTEVLLDCGPGAIGNLRLHSDFRLLGGIVISHMHADHFLDLIPLRCGLRFVGPISEVEVPRIPLHLPPGGRDVLLGVMASLPMSVPDKGVGSVYETLAEVYDIAEFKTGAPFSVGPLTIVPHAVTHDIPAWAFEVVGSRRFAYSGDSGPCDGLVDAARGADLFLCEMGAPDRTGLDEILAGVRAHMSAAEAAVAARRAGARRLVLTHYWHEYNVSDRAREAEAVFGPNVEIAVVNSTYRL